MTAQTKNQLKALVWAVVAGVIILSAPKAADQVILRPEFEKRVGVVNAEFARIESRMDAKLDRIFDAVCQKDPHLRACR